MKNEKKISSTLLNENRRKYILEKAYSFMSIGHFAIKRVFDKSFRITPTIFLPDFPKKRRAK